MKNLPLLSIKKLIAPSHWACYFINNDSSGLDEFDMKQIRVWSEFHEVKVSNCVCSEPHGIDSFYNKDRINQADCEVYSFLVVK